MSRSGQQFRSDPFVVEDIHFKYLTEKLLPRGRKRLYGMSMEIVAGNIKKSVSNTLKIVNGILNINMQNNTSLAYMLGASVGVPGLILGNRFGIWEGVQ